MEPKRILFREFLDSAFDNGNYETDDVIAFVLPLFRKVMDLHESGLVAGFREESSLYITDRSIHTDEQMAHRPLYAKERVQKLFADRKSRQFDVVGKTKIEADTDSGLVNAEDMLLHLNTSEPVMYPAYLPGYRCFEEFCGHHDEQTDIFCLGLVLGSITLGLNLYDEDDLRQFTLSRANPVFQNERIHPTISAMITEMTELDRKKRSADLYDIIHRLEHYRDYDPEKQTDLGKVAGWINKDLKDRSQFILNKLRNRLFDNSRRNRLLYYKPNLRFVNLTVSSVPMVLHYQSIRPELLFTWNHDIASKVAGMKEMVLNRFLRFEDHPYLSASLDKIRVESQRDTQEFGFSQLKLVVAFLNWHNLKEDASERIQTPLLLVPVELKKTKRLREDHFVMKVLDNEAEVNPVLANQLRELYGIRLPDYIDLHEMSLEKFFQLLKSQIDAANQGIVLQYIDKPRIRLVQAVARQTVSHFRKRLRRNDQLSSYKDIPYSYRREQYMPLGLEIFRKRIEPGASLLEFLVNEDIKPSRLRLTGPEVKQREMFEMAESGQNPYSWDFDLCNMVLGNFNYKKMSLVRDYNQVIEERQEHPVFEALFSNQPRPLQNQGNDPNQPENWHHVISADPTQTRAILQSRTGDSYVIQGPPGTGKSQTITNLVADFVARGKNVLFVCEKRAALDVVYHRLKQNGLDELCCYIHDSQGDKREFIRDLRSTYEDFSRNRPDLDDILKKRAGLQDRMKTQLEILRTFHEGNKANPAAAGLEIRWLIDRLIELKPSLKTLEPIDQELVPAYQNWLQFGHAIEQLDRALKDAGLEGSFSEQPISKLKETVFTAEQPLTLLDSLLHRARGLLKEIRSVTEQCNISPEHREFLYQVRHLVQDSVLLEPLAIHDNLCLVDPRRKEARAFEKKVQALRKLKKDQEQIIRQNENWKEKFPEQDTRFSLSIAQKNEGSFFSFLNGSWRRLKKQLHQAYDFSKHPVKPAYSSILQLLQEEYELTRKLLEGKDQLQEEYKLDNIETTCLAIDVLRNKKGDKEIDYLLAHPDANEIVTRLYGLNNSLHQLELQLQQCLTEYADKPLAELEDDLENISINASSLRELLPALKLYAALPENLRRFLCRLPLSPVQAEAAMAHQTLEQYYRQHKNFADTGIDTIERAVKELQLAYRQLLRINADSIRAGIRQRFLLHMEISNTALSQLTAEQKAFKKNYNEGRRILENEFGKSMRFKSIRELSAKESGLVLKDIKPVWLMSPLSVSDSLPLDPTFFDVVIFDEASQITLEEGVPALYRSTQAIIVGDDKQMPPTNFFTAKADDPDDLDEFDPDGDDELLSADADSLLVQGTRKLPATMLSWHYRSRFETLISYSNHAFYEGDLLTIPDRTIHHRDRVRIDAKTPEDAVQFADFLFDRSISFHFQSTGVYEKRSNQQEANYIARLVNVLLKRKIKESIGIVAFSQEQQHAIEDALTTLAAGDKDFEQLLEEAYNRTEDDQFVGLIIKNLENIQGDERDIIIMSVCYGYDSRKRMLMNFGPINKKGGEKRLNVIFSRAKKHMAIISSIHHADITNEYNEGASYFRRFLQYAENVSSGNMKTARLILDGLVIKRQAESPVTRETSVSGQVRRALEKLGYEVAQQVGQSDFKCSLAVRVAQQDEEYTLGILVDDEKHYHNENLLEQYYQRPAILQSFGWRWVQVFAKDWLQDPDRVLRKITKALEQLPVETGNQPEAGLLRGTDPSGQYARPENQHPAPAAGIGIGLPGMEDIRFERFLFSEEGSNKFWEVGIRENKLIVRYGRIGSKGQTLVKTFPDQSKAISEKEKMIREKTARGYKKEQG